MKIQYASRAALPRQDSWARQASLRLLGSFVLLCWAMIALLSFFPFETWRRPDEPIFDFLFYPLPFYVLRFDLIVNVAAYLPYGFALALLPRRRGVGFMLALLLGALTSLLVEVGQMFVPTRIASNLDILCNVFGAFLGAVLATVPIFRVLGAKFLQLRQLWFRSSAITDYFLVLLLLWFVTQLDPTVPWFGVVVMPSGLPQPFVSPIEDAALFLWLLEVGSTFCNVLGTLLLVTLCVRRGAWRLTAAILFLWLAFVLKLGVAAIFLKPSAMWDWLGLRVGLGVGLGVVALALIVPLPRLARALFTFLALAGMLVLEAFWPLNAGEFYDLSKVRQHYGHMLNLAALADHAVLVWPWLVLMVMMLGVVARVRLPFLGAWWFWLCSWRVREREIRQNRRRFDWVKKYLRRKE